jgi:hypothetical protein
MAPGIVTLNRFISRQVGKVAGEGERLKNGGKPSFPLPPVQSALSVRLGSVFEDLLDVDVHQPQKGGGDGVTVAFVESMPRPTPKEAQHSGAQGPPG